MSPRQTAHLFSIALFILGCFFVPQEVFAADIVINEFLVDPSSQQWVELYNIGSSPLDIGGWFIDDSGGSEKFVIPSGTIISPHEFKVFESSYFNLNTSTSDVLQLLNGTTVIDSYAYEISPGVNATFGRNTDGLGGWVIFNSPSKGSSNNSSIPAPTVTPTIIPPTLTTLPTPTIKPSSTPKPASPTPSSKPSVTPKPTVTFAPTITSKPANPTTKISQLSSSVVYVSTGSSPTALSKLSDTQVLVSSSSSVLTASVSAPILPTPHKINKVSVQGVTNQSLFPIATVISGILLILGCAVFQFRGRIKKLLWEKVE